MRARERTPGGGGGGAETMLRLLEGMLHINRTYRRRRRRSWGKLHQVVQGGQRGGLEQGQPELPPRWVRQALLLSRQLAPHAPAAWQHLPERLPAAAALLAAWLDQLLPWPWQLPGQLLEQPATSQTSISFKHVFTCDRMGMHLYGHNLWTFTVLLK